MSKRRRHGQDPRMKARPIPMRWADDQNTGRARVLCPVCGKTTQRDDDSEPCQCPKLYVKLAAPEPQEEP